jgi:hypothetical protein
MIFSTGEGGIYAMKPNGELVWSRMKGTYVPPIVH